MASPTPSLGQGLLLFWGLYAGGVLATAILCAGFVAAAKRREARQHSDGRFSAAAG